MAEDQKIPIVEFKLGKITKEALASDPDESIPAAFEAIRVQLQATHGAAVTAGERAEAIAKAMEDVQALTTAQKELLADYRAALRTAPEAGEVREGKLNLGAARGWEHAVSSDDNVSKDQVARSLSQISLAHYNILCRRPAQLGLDPKSPEGKAMDRFQAVSDRLTLRLAMLNSKPSLLMQVGGWQKLPEGKEYVELAERLGAAAHVALNAQNETTNSEGKYWVPSDILSSRILPYVESARLLPSQYENIPMPGPVFSMGVQGSRLKPRKIVENVADAGNTSGATIEKQSIVTKLFQFTAAGYATGVLATPWWLEDSIVNADFVIREGSESILRGIEDWLMNGQLGGAIDSVSIGSTDIRNCGNGLRYFYAQMQAAGLFATGAGPIDLTGGLTGEAVAKIFGNQGRYAHRASESIWITGNLGMTHCLLLKTQSGQNLVQTYAETGGAGTVRTGQLAVMYGRPIVVSDEVPETMDDNGLVPASPGTKTALYHSYTPAVKIGHRGGVVVDYSKDARFWEHQDSFKFVGRSDIKHGYDVTTEPTINAGFGLGGL